MRPIDKPRQRDELLLAAQRLRQDDLYRHVCGFMEKIMEPPIFAAPDQIRP